ncbi:site-specific integrase, partial [Nocardioides abyssi]
GLPLPEVDDYVLALSARKRSVNTEKAYCQHLAALFTFLHARGLAWEEAEFGDLSEFMVVFQTGVHPLQRTRGSGPRDVKTVRAAAAAVKGF